MQATATRRKSKANKRGTRSMAVPTDTLFSTWEEDRAVEWHPLVKHVVFTYFGNLVATYGADELLSEANITLAKVIKCFDGNRIAPQTGRPVNFNTYAIAAMRRNLATWAGKQKEKESRLRFVSLATLDSSDDESEQVQVEDTAFAEMTEEMESAEYARKELVRRLRRLKPVHVAIFLQFLGGFLRSDGVEMPRLSLGQLATKYGTAPPYIARIIKKATEELGLEKLPRYLFDKLSQEPTKFAELLDPEFIPDFQLSLFATPKGERVAG